MNRLVGLLPTGRARKVVLLATFIVLAAGAVAVAAPNGLLTAGPAGPQGLVAVGPVNASNGFPDWYRDSNGIDLMPCDDPQDQYCGGAVPAPDPTQPPTFPGNFPDEFFYQQAGADSLVSAGGNKVLAEFDLEGAFGSGPVKAGDQITFARTRYKIVDGLQPNTDYKVTQPYGTDTIHTDAGATGFFVTEDVGVVPGDFSGALKGRVGPFLQWDNTAPAPPAGYVGDGVTPHAVTGSSFNTNFVRIQGPGIGGAAGTTNPNPCPTTGANAYVGAVNDCIQTNNFVLVGKKSTLGGVDVTRATYERNATGGAPKVQVLANSKSGQDIVVRDGDNHGGPGRKIATTPFRADAGRYMSRVDGLGGLPTSVDVINRGDSPQTVKNVPLVDALSASAVYHTSASGGGDVLHVQASSSDGQLSPTSLTVASGYNKALGSTGSVDIPTLAPPDQVTVTSSKGGSVTVPVAIDGAGLAALPLRADAGVDQTVDQGAKVTLDGGGSAGDIDTMSWSAPAGVTLTGGTTATPTFTAPTTAGKLTFTLTVTGNGQTQTDSVDVTVKASNPALAVIAPVGASVLQNLPLTLDATGSSGAKFEWSQVSGTAVALNGDTTSSKLTFLFPKTATPIVMQVRVRRADAPATGCTLPTCDTAQITLVPTPDPLNANGNALRAKFDGKDRWTISGGSNITVSNNVRVYSGPSVGGNAPLIGSALVDPTGAWKVDVRGSAIKPAACNCVSAESDRGGVALSIPLT
jgi:hypothetical protein